MREKYFLSSDAEKDIEEVVTYLAKENPKAAHTFLDTLYETMDNLAENPHMGHTREDVTNKPVKFWTFKWHYLIIYKPESPLNIVRILSGYRDLINLLG